MHITLFKKAAITRQLWEPVKDTVRWHHWAGVLKVWSWSWTRHTVPFIHSFIQVGRTSPQRGLHLLAPPVVIFCGALFNLSDVDLFPFSRSEGRAPTSKLSTETLSFSGEFRSSMTGTQKPTSLLRFALFLGIKPKRRQKRDESHLFHCLIGILLYFICHLGNA